MTRKEAAGVIKFEKACVLRQDTPRCNRDCKKCDLLLPTEDVLTAYDMAIKALEQQLCQDAISMEMALDCDMSIRLNKFVITQYPVGEYDYLSLRRACFHGIELAKHEMEGYLIDLPSVTPQPKTGRWIHKKNALGEDITVCSECGKQMRQGEIRFCGACGAKMEVKE